MQVIKRDGSRARFDTAKPRQWAQWSSVGLENQIEMEYYMTTETIKRLPDLVTTEEIHQTMINVCLDKEEIEFSRAAAVLERGTIYKNQESLLGIYKPENATFVEYLVALDEKGKWYGDWLDDVIEQQDLVNDWFVELESRELEFWTVKQWSDKYSIKINKEPVETPALGCLAIAIAYHGVCDLAFKVAQDLLYYRTNLPTPALNGVRNGDFNSISCCVIEGGDTVDSIDVAEHIASKMTSKKAGIGITLDTRSKGDDVKGGAVEHLGKAPLYKSIETSVKKYTQVTRGGSATMTMKCIDPDIMEQLLWKTQRIDLSQRIDKMDYSFAYNDDFIRALLNEEDWYLFSKYWAPEVHDNFHSPDYEDHVRAAIKRGAPYTKIPAMDILKRFASGRFETGRLYCINLTRSNLHTPFIDRISQSNLCMEIQLPTKPYTDMFDIYRSDVSVGETAFCSLGALNVANIDFSEYFSVARRALETVHQMIMRAPMMTPSMEHDLLKRKSVGIGITGLASYLYKLGLDYDGSEESIEAVEQIAELHYYSLLKASQDMVSEGLAPAVEGIDVNWLPIDTMKSNRRPTLDWEKLRGKPRAHSVLVAHMPTESSAVFSNATNGVYPCRSRVVYKKARKGRVQFISEFFTKDKLSAYQVDMIPYYGAIQNYSDQAISADYYTDFTKLPGKKIPMVMIIEWFIKQAVAGVKTAYYQNFLETDGEIEIEESCEGGGCKL